LLLSPSQVSTTPSSTAPAGGGGRLSTGDVSSTLPPTSTKHGGPAFVDFVNFAYTGNSDDKGGVTLDTTREGYVEIIEMATYPAFTTTAIEVTHVAGVPPCGAALTDAQAS